MRPDGVDNGVRSTGAALFAFLIGLLGPTNAHAGEPGSGEARGATVQITRGPGAERCPDAPAIAAAVSTALGRPGFVRVGSGDAETSFGISIDRGAQGFSASIRATGRRRGERTLTDEGLDCAGLGEALVTLLVIVLDPRTTAVTIEIPSPPASPASSGGGSSPPPPEEGPPPEDDQPPPGITAAAPSPLRVDAHASLALTRGLLPETAGGVSGGLRLRTRRPFSLAPGLLYVFEQERGFAPGTVAVSLLSGSLAGCFLPLDRPQLPRLSVCLTPMGGALRGSGRGYEAPRSVTRPWFAMGAGAQIDGDLIGPLGWTLGGSVIAPITREKLAIAGLGLVHDPPGIAFVGTLGLRVGLR